MHFKQIVKVKYASTLSSGLSMSNRGYGVVCMNRVVPKVSCLYTRDTEYL